MVLVPNFGRYHRLHICSGFSIRNQYFSFGMVRHPSRQSSSKFPRRSNTERSVTGNSSGRSVFGLGATEKRHSKDIFSAGCGEDGQIVVRNVPCLVIQDRFPGSGTARFNGNGWNSRSAVSRRHQDATAVCTSAAVIARWVSRLWRPRIFVWARCSLIISMRATRAASLLAARQFELETTVSNEREKNILVW